MTEESEAVEDERREDAGDVITLFALLVAADFRCVSSFCIFEHGNIKSLAFHNPMSSLCFVMSLSCSSVNSPSSPSPLIDHPSSIQKVIGIGGEPVCRCASKSL